MNKLDLEEMEIGTEFWDENTSIKMIKFGNNKFAMVFDEDGNVITKPKEH